MDIENKLKDKSLEEKLDILCTELEIDITKLAEIREMFKVLGILPQVLRWEMKDIIRNEQILGSFREKDSQFNRVWLLVNALVFALSLQEID
jgi:hypothetical protein